MKEEYLDFKDKYTEKINEKIDDAWPFITESFVEYYKEEYKDVIKNRLEDILFVYYVSDFLIEYVIHEYVYNIKTIENMTKEIVKILEINESENEILDESNKPEIYEFIFGKYRFFNSNLKNLKILSFDKRYEYLSTKSERNIFINELFNKDSLTIDDEEKIQRCIKYIIDNLENIKICEKKLKEIKSGVKISRYVVGTDVYKKYVEDKKTLVKNFYELGEEKLVGLSVEDALKYNVLRDYIYAMILRKENYNPFELSLPIDDGFLVKLIGLPIFLTTDKNLIHEINHAIRSSIIAKKLSNNTNSIFDNYVVKNGVEIGDIDNFKKIEELLADISALEIYEIFKSKYKDTIFDDNILNEVTTGNENNIFIAKFFNMYKDIINHDSIGGNLDLLFSYVGEENFNRLANFVNSNYDKINSLDNLLELDIILNDIKIYSKRRIKK